MDPITSLLIWTLKAAPFAIVFLFGIFIGRREGREIERRAQRQLPPANVHVTLNISTVSRTPTDDEMTVVKALRPRPKSAAELLKELDWEHTRLLNSIEILEQHGVVELNPTDSRYYIAEPLRQPPTN